MCSSVAVIYYTRTGNDPRQSGSLGTIERRGRLRDLVATEKAQQLWTLYRTTQRRLENEEIGFRFAIISMKKPTIQKNCSLSGPR